MNGQFGRAVGTYCYGSYCSYGRLTGGPLAALCDGSSHVRNDYCIKPPLKPLTTLAIIKSCAVIEYSLCIWIAIFSPSFPFFSL